MTNVLFKWLAPLGVHKIRSCENYYVAMPSSSDLGATKTASTKTKSNSIITVITFITSTHDNDHTPNCYRLIYMIATFIIHTTIGCGGNLYDHNSLP